MVVRPTPWMMAASRPTFLLGLLAFLTGYDPVTPGLAYQLWISPPNQFIDRLVCGLDYVFTMTFQF